jgi:hypothetical protein
MTGFANIYSIFFPLRLGFRKGDYFQKTLNSLLMQYYTNPCIKLSDKEAQKQEWTNCWNYSCSSTPSVYAGDICSFGLQEMTVHCYGSPDPESPESLYSIDCSFIWHEFLLNKSIINQYS